MVKYSDVRELLINEILDIQGFYVEEVKLVDVHISVCEKTDKHDLCQKLVNLDESNHNEVIPILDDVNNVREIVVKNVIDDRKIEKDNPLDTIFREV